MTYYNIATMSSPKIIIAFGLIVMGIGAGAIVFVQNTPEPGIATAFGAGLIWSVGAILTGLAIYRMWSNRKDPRLELR